MNNTLQSGRVTRAMLTECPSPMDDDTVRFAADFFAALSNPARVRIVELLAEGERMVGEIAGQLGLCQPTVSHHLAILGRAGIVAATPAGTARWYQLRGPRVPAILLLLSEFRQIHRNGIEHSISRPAVPAGARLNTWPTAAGTRIGGLHRRP